MTGRSEESIRDAHVEDAAACAAIYAPYVSDGATSFETAPPSADEMSARIRRAQSHHAWLVAERAGEVTGYAYGGTFRARDAYRYAAEVSVYLRPDVSGRGLGRALLEVLLERLERRGLRTAIAVITLPNPASERLHERLGFARVGVLRGVGWKHGAWHDVLWMQRALGVGPTTPPGGDPITRSGR